MSKPVCDTCNDTHQMMLHGENGDVLRDRMVMCTFCPSPCQRCRQGGNGPYCTKTPCACSCHKGKYVESKPDTPKQVLADYKARVQVSCESCGGKKKGCWACAHGKVFKVQTEDLAAAIEQLLQEKSNGEA